MTPFARGFIDGFTLVPLWRYIAKPYIEAEREACARLCDSIQLKHEIRARIENEIEERDFRDACACGAEDCAEAIRASQR